MRESISNASKVFTLLEFIIIQESKSSAQFSPRHKRTKRSFWLQQVISLTLFHEVSFNHSPQIFINDTNPN